MKAPASPRKQKAQPLPETPRPARRFRPRLVAAGSMAITMSMLIVLHLLSVIDLWPFDAAAPQAVDDPDAPLASFYSPSVKHWKPQIHEWAAEYGLNPNVVAIVIQIESCGDPSVISWAGATGLMQVMPFHFDNGENMLNPATNMQHGMEVFMECLYQFSDGDLGLALACYNGGPSVTLSDPEYWALETQNYYRWGTGLWQDVVRGHNKSATLDEWLAAGGARLCTQAEKRIS
jgi:soluble lytic murein transglycosylase-like protein